MALSTVVASPLGALVTLLVLSPVLILVKRYFISPLNSIPGPWWARLSPIPLFYLSAVCQQQAQTIEQLHKKYGPIVRIAPNEVAVASLASFKIVHKIGSGFVKSGWYEYIGPTEKNYGPAGLFQEVNPHKHAATRKLFARGFTAANLRGEWEDMVREKAMKAVEGMAKDAAKSNGICDIRRWWTFMASDVVTQLMFGEALGGLETETMHAFFYKVHLSNLASCLSLYMPAVYAVLCRIPLPALTEFFSAWKALLDIASIAYQNSLGSATKKNIFSTILEKAEAGETGLTPMQITVEAGDFVIAGSDTTSETLTYLVWSVLKRPEVAKVLHQELALKASGELKDAELEKLPILNAVIKETLRLYTPIPMPQPRVVPKGGCTLEGQFLPEGTVVNTTPWVSHRDPTIFPDPEIFDYRRWLPDGSASLSADARAAWWPFGAGTRTCIGSNLAMMELRLGASIFFRRFFGAKLAPETTDESMIMMNYVVIQPKGGCLKVDFSEVKA